MKTKLLLAVVIAGVAGFAVSFGLLNPVLKQERAELAKYQAAWQDERAELQAALERARSRSPGISTVAAPVQLLQATNQTSAAEILERLKALRASTNSPRGARLVIHQLESLLELGPAALPDIRKFLAQNLDLEYDAAGRRAFRDGQVPLDFQLPPSLRLGLLEIARNIGGEGGEQLLAEVLQNTGRGVELAYAAYALQGMAPDKYRDSALAAAHDLLGKPLAPGSTSALDKVDRDSLYAVLAFFKDSTYVATAQSQMVQPNGKVDPRAVRYLQQALGEQSISLAAQAWQDTRIPADQKEPFARIALAYAGLNPQADQLYQTAINDPAIPADHRKNLIEDLNEAGFIDRKNLSPADLALVQKRIAMIEQLAPHSMDDVNARAFQEAYKDLVKMNNSALPKPAPAK